MSLKEEFDELVKRFETIPVAQRTTVATNCQKSFEKLFAAKKDAGIITAALMDFKKRIESNLSRVESRREASASIKELAEKEASLLKEASSLPHLAEMLQKIQRSFSAEPTVALVKDIKADLVLLKKAIKDESHSVPVEKVPIVENAMLRNGDGLLTFPSLAPWANQRIRLGSVLSTDIRKILCDLAPLLKEKKNLELCNQYYNQIVALESSTDAPAPAPAPAPVPAPAPAPVPAPAAEKVKCIYCLLKDPKTIKRTNYGDSGACQNHYALAGFSLANSIFNKYLEQYQKKFGKGEGLLSDQSILTQIERLEELTAEIEGAEIDEETEKRSAKGTKEHVKLVVELTNTLLKALGEPLLLSSFLVPYKEEFNYGDEKPEPEDVSGEADSSDLYHVVDDAEPLEEDENAPPEVEEPEAKSSESSESSDSSESSESSDYSESESEPNQKKRSRDSSGDEIVAVIPTKVDANPGMGKLMHDFIEAFIVAPVKEEPMQELKAIANNLENPSRQIECAERLHEIKKRCIKHYIIRGYFPNNLMADFGNHVFFNMEDALKFMELQKKCMQNVRLEVVEVLTSK